MIGPRMYGPQAVLVGGVRRRVRWRCNNACWWVEMSSTYCARGRKRKLSWVELAQQKHATLASFPNKGSYFTSLTWARKRQRQFKSLPVGRLTFARLLVRIKAIAWLAVAVEWPLCVGTPLLAAPLFNFALINVWGESYTFSEFIRLMTMQFSSHTNHIIL